MKKHKSKNIIIILIFINIISKIFGFTRDIVLAYYYGTTIISDIYISVVTLPEFLFDIISQTINMGFIPIAAGLISKNAIDENIEIKKFTDNIITIFSVITIFAIIVLEIITPYIIKIIMPSYMGESYVIACNFLKIILISIIFKIITCILSSYLYIKKSFIPTSIIGIIMDIGIIISIIYSYRIDKIFLAIGTVISLAVQLVFILFFAMKRGYRYNFYINIKSAELKDMVKMFLPGLIVVGVNQLILIINRSIATGISVGAVTMLNYASKMGFFMENIIVLSIVSYIYPKLSELYNSKKYKEFNEIVNKAIFLILILLIPMTFGLIILSNPIITFIFGRGNFDHNSIIITANLMKIYSLGIVGVSLQTIYARIIHITKNLKLSILCYITIFIINIIMTIIMVKIFDIKGIAATTTIIYITGAVIFGYVIKKHNVNIITIDKILIIYFIKIILASIIMAFIVYNLYNFLNKYNSILAILISVCIGIITYSITILLLKVKKFSEFKDIFKLT